jgi:hypothetical protein
MMPSTSPKCNRSLCRVFLFAFLLHLPDFSTLPRSTPRQRSLLLYSSVFASSVADKTTAVAENLSSVSFVLQLSFFLFSFDQFVQVLQLDLRLSVSPLSSHLKFSSAAARQELRSSSDLGRHPTGMPTPSLPFDAVAVSRG